MLVVIVSLLSALRYGYSRLSSGVRVCAARQVRPHAAALPSPQPMVVEARAFASSLAEAAPRPEDDLMHLVNVSFGAKTPEHYVFMSTHIGFVFLPQ